MNRRKFLKNVGVGVGAASFGFPNISRGATRYRVPALVIGSGFGGAVTALRLGEAGVRTAVLERGRSWLPSATDPLPFANILDQTGTPTGDGRLGWLTNFYNVPGVPAAQIPKYTGVLETVDGNGMTVLAGAGVGGGSLVYGATLQQPTRQAFNRSMPWFIDYDDMDQNHYPVAKAMLGVRNVFAELNRLADPSLIGPAAFTTYQAFLSGIAEAQAAEAANPDRLRTVFLDAGVNFDIVQKEMEFLFQGGSPIDPSFITGNFSLSGANSGAKNSLDKNYLPAAQATGNVTIHPLHQVDYFERVGNRYEVHIDRINEQGEPQERIIVSCKYLALGAGSLGTTKLLLKSKREGLDLPNAVGKRWGTNGDLLGTRQNIGALGQPIGLFGLPLIGGPAVALVEDSANPLGPTSVEYAGGLGAMQTLGQATVASGRGKLVYDAHSDSIRPDWPGWAQLAVYGAVESTQKLLNAVPSAPGCGFPRFNAPQVDPNVEGCFDIPADPSCVPPPTLADFAGGLDCLARPNTYHPLGGAVFGRVCNRNGEVYGADNLFVMDGALIPGSTGAVNPALTITAIAERNMSRLLGNANRMNALVNDA